MNVIDLTHRISETMPVYPGTQGPKIIDATTIEGDGFAEKLITFYSHTGTHMDAPGHMIAGAKTLDQFEVDCFVGSATIVDTRACVGGAIDLGYLERHWDSIRGKDFVIFRTGWSARWGQVSYFADFPLLTGEAAEGLAGLGLKGIGVDVISVDKVDSRHFPIHNTLFRAGLLIVENLANLASVDAPVFTFSCLPLNFTACDGSPVRAVAIL